MGCDKEITLNFVIAHSDEARPFIDFFRLPKNTSHNGFNVFEKDGVRLIVSGQGNLNAATATAYLAGNCASTTPPAIWVNVGIAGHRDHDVGSLWRVNKVTDGFSGRCIYPVALQTRRQGRAYVRGCALTSVASTVCDYSGACLYDMEAAGFFQTAVRFATLESIVSFKVVSDNQSHPCAVADIKSMAALLQPHVGQMVDHLESLKTIININKPPQNIEINNIKLTHSQKEIVSDLIMGLTVHGVACEHEIGCSKNARQLIAVLTKKLKDVELML